MKRTACIVGLLICILIVAGILLFKSKSLPRATGFDVPHNAAYVVLYSTGPDAVEKTELNYLDKNGDCISRNIIDNVASSEAFTWCEDYNKYTLFTHDEIYFSGEKKYTIANEEMKSTYKFASLKGDDTIYDSGFIDKINMYFKYIPHGYAYAQSDLGTFDLITLYNDKSIRNFRIIEGSSVAIDQSTGIIYAITNNDYKLLDYKVIRPDSNGEKFHVENKKLDLSKFYEKHAKNKEDIVTINKAVICENKIYQVISVGEQDCKTYLAEISIADDGKTLCFEDAHPMNIESDGIISFDTPVMISDNTIKYYSDVKPNKIITFDIEKKKFTYQPWLEDTVGQEDKEYDVRIIDNTVYVLKVNYGKNAKDNVFSISKANDNGDLEELVSGTLPESKIENDHWRSDFYVINN